MNSIVKNYNQLVRKYREIEKETSENEIHDKRVILRRIFPIITVYKMNLTDVKNGEMAFRLFGKLRDVQVQILKLESMDQSPEFIDYLTFLKHKEVKLKVKTDRLSKKKEIEFPVLKNKSNPTTSKIEARTRKSLNKLVEKEEAWRNDESANIHEIRIAFKKFRYIVEVLSYQKETDEEKLVKLKYFQDKLGEIQDYELLINGMKNYFKTKGKSITSSVGFFKDEQNELIEAFDKEVESLIAVCRELIPQNSKAKKDVNEI